MAPKADSTAKDNNSTKTFSFDDVAYLIAKLEANKVGLGAKDYQNMAQLNGDRSEHGYNHLFRGVKARGKDLLPMITGGAASPVGRKTKAGANGEKKGAKRGKLPSRLFRVWTLMAIQGAKLVRRSARMSMARR